MAEEYDVFAGAVNKGNAPGKQHQEAPAAQPNKHKFHRVRNGGKNFNRPQGQKPNHSPIRGANGEESVNPLLNAPLPSEPAAAEPEAAANPNRNPDLPEYRLADIQTWPAPVVVERMMPGADPEELGSYRKHMNLIYSTIG
jgi:hypothetical protein